jgi:PAS domain S-box-containing protein
VIGMTADITGSVHAEEALQRSEARFHELVRKLPIAVAIKDRGRMVYFNERFEQTFGYTLDDIPDEAAWWQKAYPDERYRREVVAFWKEAERQGSQNGKDFEQHECHITCKDGTLRIAEAVAGTSGDPKLILLNDVTERKRAEEALRESEERFRNIADTAPVIIWVCGSDGMVTFVNREALHFAGQAMEQVLGTGWAEIVDPDDRDRLNSIITSAIGDRRGFQVEVRARRADGQLRWILNTAAPRFAGGSYAGHIGIGIDITDLKRNQERMHQAQKLESLGVLASGIAHDFNNLLGSILADSEVALSELPDGSPARAELERIGMVAIRASEIVGQLMVYAGEETKFEAIDISRLVEEMLGLLGVSVSKHCVLKTSLPIDLPAVRGNPAQVRQVVMNLITNASEAIGERDGVITILAAREDKGPSFGASNGGKLPAGDYVSLEVSDTGCGMTDEIQARIFDPFFTTKFAGRGLGLAAVQGIVRAHGGSLDVDSVAGQGTTFRILLPCAGEPASPTVGPAISATVEDPTPPGAVLLVEDEEMLRLAVSKLLRKRGFSIMEAGDGTAALELIRAYRDTISVVLLDVTLPGKSSREVFEEAKRIQPGVQVILTSAYGPETVASSFPGLPFARFIRKPYAPRDLVLAIRDTLLAAGRQARGAHSKGA